MKKKPSRRLYTKEIAMSSKIVHDDENNVRISWQEYQKIHKFKETNYSVKSAAWKMLDFGNPAWAPIDYSQHGKNMEKDERSIKERIEEEYDKAIERRSKPGWDNSHIPWCCRENTEMQNRSLFPNDKWCLTCNKPESVLLNDITYGHWNYCKCSRDKFSLPLLSGSLGNLPPQPTAEFISKHRRTTMKWAVSAEITLQDGNEETKVLPTVGYVTFEVEADDLDAAIVIARSMLEINTNEGIISSIAAVLEA